MIDLKFQTDDSLNRPVRYIVPPTSQNSDLHNRNEKPNQTQDLDSFEREKVELHKSPDDSAPSHQVNSAESENVEPLLNHPEISHFPTIKNAELPINPLPVSTDSEKSSVINPPQKTKKTSRSQKRRVISKKFFVSPEEDEILEKEVKENELSFSNFVRLRFGFGLNKKGRRKKLIDDLSPHPPLITDSEVDEAFESLCEIVPAKFD